MSFNWLPPLMKRADFPSEQAYIDALYAVFKRDFLDTARQFNRLPVKIKRHPPYQGIFAGKEATFRHLITEGPDEANRVIVPERCERIGWMLPLIQNHNKSDVLVWENKRDKNGAAYVLALSDFSYKLVLTQRTDFVLLWTQFPVVYTHTQSKMKKEYEAYQTRNS